jgi:predicted lipoprotein with Yx(FWY)xxD motif
MGYSSSRLSLQWYTEAMRTSTIVWIVIILVILIGGWYIWMQESVPAPASTSTTSTTATTSNPSAIQNNLTLGTDATTSLGTYLIGYNGMTLYSFADDSTGTSTCYGNCAQQWPPYVVPAGMQLNLEAGVNGQAGTIARADGTTQVTYNGMPLYFYIGDTKSGDTNGNRIGGVWAVAQP